MSIERGFRAKLKYRTDEFLSGGAGRQLFFLFACTMLIVVVFTGASLALGLEAGENVEDHSWFYFTRLLDAGTMAEDTGHLHRFTSTLATIMGVVVAGLLISSLSGNFQERLDAIRRGGGTVMEEQHFLILGWSEKIYSVIDQISEAYVAEGRIVVVVMADREKIEMEELLRDKVVHLDRMKLVVRQGSSLSLSDLNRVSFELARAVVVLVDDRDVDDPNQADGRIIKTLLALYNHPDSKGLREGTRVTAEVMLAANREIALIASSGRAEVVKTNEMISKVLLQTSRISGLALVYDELLRFEGNEIHYKKMAVAGRRFGDILLDFPGALVVGVAKANGASHLLNPPADHVIAADEELLILAEDADIKFDKYKGPLDLAKITVPSEPSEKPVEQLLILGWNSKIFSVIEEFDSYVGEGSTLTLVNVLPEAERVEAIAAKCPAPKNITIHHIVGEFTSRSLMERLQPQKYPTVMVLGDASAGGGAEESDTRAIIALLLLRDFRKKANIAHQEVCSEILNPKNRELAATTEIHDIVISNEMVSMVLAQVTYEPRIRPVLEDLFQSDGSEIYLKDMTLYAKAGDEVSFEHLVLAAKVRGEVALGIQRHSESAAEKYGIRLNPQGDARRARFVPSEQDRLIVLSENDG